MPSITPLKLKTGDSTANGEEAKRTERRIYSVSEMEDHFVGSQTPLDFLRTWMGKKSPQKELEAKFPTAQSVFMKEFDASQNEGDRTKILSKIVNELALLGNDLEFRDTHTQKIRVRGHELMPDGQIRHKLGHDNPTYPPHVPEGSGEEKGSVPCDVVLEFKTEDGSDPFTDVPQKNQTCALSVDNLSEDKTQVLGQLIDYAQMMFYGTFRTHAFMVLFTGDYARFLRWEHSVFVVSQRFNYVQDPYKLVAFFQAYVKADAATRGWDTTYKDSFELPLVRFDVRNGDKTLKCIGSARPNFTTHHLHGRATRGWIVYEQTSGKLMYYKRAWRIAEDNLEKEGVVYDRLRKAGVRHIPTIAAHGDIEGQWHQPTKTFIKKLPWMLPQPERHDKLRAQQHYHILMEQVGIRLTNFPKSRSAVIAIKDALVACDDALIKAQTMHRDISAGNILIWKDTNGDYHGLLVDWDLSKLVTDNQARSEYRTGTWAFLSAERQRKWTIPDAEHVPEDDRESFVHVITFLGVRYCTTNLIQDKDTDEVQDFLTRVFDMQRRGVRTHGTSMKATYLMAGVGSIVNTLQEDFRIAGNVPLTELLDSLRRLFQPRYLEAKPLVISADVDDADVVDYDDRERDEDVEQVQAVEHDAPTLDRAVPVAAAREPVKAHDMLVLFKAAILSPRWPKDDKAFDHLAYNARSGYMSKGAERDRMLKNIDEVSSATRLSISSATRLSVSSATRARVSEATRASTSQATRASSSSRASKRTHAEMGEPELLDGPPSSPTPEQGSSRPSKQRKSVAAKEKAGKTSGADRVQPQAGPSRVPSPPGSRTSSRIAAGKLAPKRT